MLHPLEESAPAQRTPARQETPTAEALAWLADPHPPAPPETLHQRIAREIAEAIGWPVAQTQEAISQLHSYPGDKSE